MADRAGLPFGDTADFEAADRGLIDVGDPVVRNEAGEVVWDNGSYRGFLTGDAPDRDHHDYRPGTDRGRGADDLPDGSGHRGPGRDAFLLPGPAGAVL